MEVAFAAVAVPLALAAVIGGFLVIAGIALAAPGLLSFASVQQLHGVERGGLITEGIYRYSRNPQYTGLGIALLGAVVVARSGLALPRGVGLGGRSIGLTSGSARAGGRSGCGPARRRAGASRARA